MTRILEVLLGMVHSATWGAAYLQSAVMLLVFGLGLPALLVQLSIPEELRRVYLRSRTSLIVYCTGVLLFLLTISSIWLWHTCAGDAGNAERGVGALFPMLLVTATITLAVIGWLVVMRGATRASIMRELAIRAYHETYRKGRCWFSVVLWGALVGSSRFFTFLWRCTGRVCPGIRWAVRRFALCLVSLVRQLLCLSKPVAYRSPACTAVEELFDVTMRTDHGLERRESLGHVEKYLELVITDRRYRDRELQQVLPRIPKLLTGARRVQDAGDGYNDIAALLLKTARMIKERECGDGPYSDRRNALDAALRVASAAVESRATLDVENLLSDLGLHLPLSAMMISTLCTLLPPRLRYVHGLNQLKVLTKNPTHSDCRHAVAWLAATLAGPEVGSTASRLACEHFSDAVGGGAAGSDAEGGRRTLPQRPQAGLARHNSEFPHKPSAWLPRMIGALPRGAAEPGAGQNPWDYP